MNHTKPTQKQSRQYQHEARKWSNIQFNQGRHHLLVMPAGTGKTYTATMITKDRISLNKKLLILCGTEEIFDQWIESFSLAGINYGYINPEGVIGRNKDAYICMWQSLSNILFSLPEKFCNRFREIIIDECHHSASPTLESIFEHFHHTTRLGLTATPYRLDNRPLGKYFSTMFEPIKQKEAIENNFLCKPVIIIPELYKDIIPEDPESTNRNEQKTLIQDKKIIGDMVQLYKDVFNGAPVMIPCSSHQHAVDIAELYKKAGWKVEHVHSKLNKYERKRIINAIRKKKINILVTYAVGIEGLDVPGLYGVIWLRQTMSLTVWIQMNSRAARIEKGKNIYILVDPVGNTVIHGRPDINRKWSLDTDYTPGQDVESDELISRICPVCSTMNNSENMKCWICEYDFLTGLLDGEEIDKKKRRLPKFIDGELVYLDEKQNKEYEMDQCLSETGKEAYNEAMNECAKELTKTQKVEILSRDLVGLRNKNKFKEGIKWL